VSLATRLCSNTLAFLVAAVGVLTPCSRATELPPKESSTKHQPKFSLVDVFNAGDNGYFTYRIASLMATPRGTLIAMSAARKESHRDWGDIDIAMRRSKDHGITWDATKIVVDEGENVADNPTMLCDRDTGRLHLLYQKEYAQCFHVVSDDDGQTWSDPKDITEVFRGYRDEGYPWVVLAPGPGHALQLSSGRFVVPVWMATHRRHRPSIVSTIFSDDRGQSWSRGDVVVRNTDETPNPSESVAIQLVDGRVMLNTRCESRRYQRLISYSKDGATDWTSPKFHDGLYEPICMASMVRLSQKPTDDRNRILFCNPGPTENEEPVLQWGARDRVNVTVRLSYDEGESWPIDRRIADGPSGYSDLAVAPDGTILCLFERGNSLENKGSFSPAHVSLARFNLAWLSHGKDTLAPKDSPQ
jgi:sialidase-1